MHLHLSMPAADRAQLDDATLLDRYRAADDREALGVLFTRHVDAAYRLARRYSGSAADAEDAVQAALLRVMRLAAQFRGGTTVKAWLLSAVVSECRNLARADLRRTKREASVARAETSFDKSADDPALRQAVLAAIQELPEHYRAPVWMHYCEGLTSSDVATALNLSANTVRRQLARGVDRLRSSLGVSGRAMTLAAITATLASLPVETAPASLGSAVLSLATGGASLTAAASTSAKAGFLGKAGLSTKITAAVLTTAAATAGTVYVAQPTRPPSAEVQAVAEISPGDDHITGWRGNWTGRFPDTDPPLTWERRIKSPLKDLRCQGKKPKAADEATADRVLWTGRIHDWLLLGPVPAKSLDDAALPGEPTVQPDDGQAVAGSAWKPFSGFKALGTGSGQAVYLHAYLHAAQASKANLWHLGHSKGVRIWNNGKVVYSSAERRDGNARGHVTIDLVKGWNRLLVKLLHQDASTGIDLHLVPTPPYIYETKNFAWMTALPGPSNAQPIVVGDAVFRNRHRHP